METCSRYSWLVVFSLGMQEVQTKGYLVRHFGVFVCFLHFILVLVTSKPSRWIVCLFLCHVLLCHWWNRSFCIDGTWYVNGTSNLLTWSQKSYFMCIPEIRCSNSRILTKHLFQERAFVLAFRIYILKNIENLEREISQNTNGDIIYFIYSWNIYIYIYILVYPCFWCIWTALF